MGRIKIARKKELREPDEFLSLSQRVWLWVHDNRARAGAAVGAVAGVLLVALLAKGLVERSRERRAAELGQVVGHYLEAKEGAPAPADAAKQLEDLAGKLGDSADGLVARYYLAGALAAKGEPGRAAEQYGAVGEKAAVGDLTTLTRVGRGYAALAAGDADRALAAFQELVAAKDAVVPRAQLRLEIGAILEKKGRESEARRVYDELAQGGAESAFAAKAKERVRLLDERAKAAS